MSNAALNIPGLGYKESGNFLLIAGPCVVESEEIIFATAEQLRNLSDKYKIPFVFKSSYRKANRSKGSSFTGIGDIKALKIIADVRERFSVPVITDIHNPEEAVMAADYVDIIQIPAFLCRQTDLLAAAAKTGKWINIKKGQFLSGSSMQFAVDKVKESGNTNIILTDRGNMFGYQDIVVDFRNIPIMQKTGVPVIMDITHSLQQPNQEEGVSGGRPDMIETIGKAAISVGADGIFIETHPDPSVAKSDGANMLKLSEMEQLLYRLCAIRKSINSFENFKK
ncbi:MAG: 3-deoxy-8-phosphooctulonate synthase [Bacteroidetes bacterium GWE2_41_25]|nr:MAG: 3-deoxy-8-phosphooctulonate synthase [Bacteroidetes bacterium GWA2_40_15]OFX92239.1 MAG: 3-deoxy-8-phosphooctulonate synthase [Bacteroidetes bacterium GWC2_40_22]OFY02048.1 MAG: 3-deoxy-8-phosphooctulonate synthase [Bacteroidetes bacterium GWE2_41_25]OFY57367.1 MAG: 3-deoxy-8-phosphooctulonate synthase [Bacteroidetes bacterium GWF2_41_9]HAM08883.1 3-deoxy-8-phosphooctulonate synthase [Bacteroidales bacterium]